MRQPRCIGRLLDVQLRQGNTTDDTILGIGTRQMVLCQSRAPLAEAAIQHITAKAIHKSLDTLGQVIGSQ